MVNIVGLWIGEILGYWVGDTLWNYEEIFLCVSYGTL